MNTYFQKLAVAMVLLATSILALSSPDSGLYAGLGITYNSIHADYRNISYAGENYSEARADSNALAPALQIGYWGKFNNQSRFGIKFLYQYLSSSSSYLIADGSNYNTADFDTTHALSIIALYQRQWEKISPYLGLGGTLFTATSRIIASGDTSNSQNFSSKRGLIGAIATAGFTYQWTKNWWLDCDYSFSRTTKPQLNQSTGGITYNRYVGINVWTLAFTVNHTLSL